MNFGCVCCNSIYLTLVQCMHTNMITNTLSKIKCIDNVFLEYINILRVQSFRGRGTWSKMGTPTYESLQLN